MATENGSNRSLIFYLWLLFCFPCFKFRSFTQNDMQMYREKVVQMFHHAYNSYLQNAYPYDELRPLSCNGVDTWGSFSLTLIDALDTLAVIGNYSEFQRVVNKLVTTADFNININVSVFETNIRVVGGLLSAHLLSQKAGIEVEPGWPCSGPLLHLAETVARRLLPAFQTNTGMPYGTVNLRHGVPAGETPVTCTAGVSTFIVEFGTLSRLTGDPVFERTATRALNALWERRSPVGLVGNHINVQEGKWTAMDAGIGAGVDSYYEYLVKGGILFQKPNLIEMFKEYKRVIAKYMKKDDWYFWVSMGSGQVTMPVFQSLESYWPGLLSLVGEIEQALKTLHNYHQVWKQYGFTPEFYDVPRSQANHKREGYPLRPELVESVMYLYRATKDPYLLEIGADILESIQHSSRTDCGYASIKNVVDHHIEDRMESFFLAETTKYLYLLFDPTNFIHNNGSCGEIVSTTGGDCVLGTGGYIFNTEAHPIDVSAVYCCSADRKEHQFLLQNFQNTMDLYALLDINEKGDFLKIFKQNQRRKKCESKIFDLVERVPENCNDEICQKENSLLNEKHQKNIFSFVTSDKPTILHSFAKSDSVDHMSTNSIVRTTDSRSTMQSDIKKLYLENESDINLKHISSISSLEDSNVEAKLHSSEWTNVTGNSETSSDMPPLFLNVHQKENIENYKENSKSEFKTNELFSSEPVHTLKLNNHFQEQFVAQNTNTDHAEAIRITGTPSKTVPVVPVIPFNNVLNLDTSKDFALKAKKESYNYQHLSCPAQPFTARLTLMGEMFNTE